MITFEADTYNPILLRLSAFHGIYDLGLSGSDGLSRVKGSRDYSLTLDDLNLPAPEAR
jgi:hypothetical protein